MTREQEDAAIASLALEAAAAGDVLQLCLCELALGIADQPRDELDAFERRRLEGHTVESARRECLRVIDEGRCGR